MLSDPTADLEPVWNECCKNQPEAQQLFSILADAFRKMGAIQMVLFY